MKTTTPASVLGRTGVWPIRRSALSESTEPLFTNEPDCVILRGQLALDVIHGAPWLDPEYVA